jgi:hypothetical protein
MGYTQEHLKDVKCGNPACTSCDDELVLNPICHPGAGCEVSYTKSTGELTVRCNECKKFVADISVAHQH